MNIINSLMNTIIKLDSYIRPVLSNHFDNTICHRINYS